LTDGVGRAGIVYIIDAMKSNIEKSKCLSVLGTGSDVGKSIVVTALCRIFSDMGFEVAPYKAQNMSNNSYITKEGLEIGRAQVVQAQAARVEPLADMNPVLLKPSSDTGAQVVLRGKAIGNCLAKDYFANTDFLAGKALESLNRLREDYKLIVMEGAGSCAEINLLERDYVNFRMAREAGAPVILVADIDRGGVFAQIIGTLNILPPEYASMVKGIIVNRFRGDASLFDDGIKYIEQKTGLPVLGVIPHFYHIEIDAEDGMPIETLIDPAFGPVGDKVNIACLRLPHISNFTDFNPLIRHKRVNFHYLSKPRELHGYDLLILPGSKNTRFDIKWLSEAGWLEKIRRFDGEKGRILGVCGGYQMMGLSIEDPEGIEGDPGATPGLGMLNVRTVLHNEKLTTCTTGKWPDLDHATVTGYEIHMGRTSPCGSGRPVLHLESSNGLPIDEPDGWQCDGGRLMGVYLHGLFDEPRLRQRFLDKLCPNLGLSEDDDYQISLGQFRDRQYNLLAEHFRTHLNMGRLMEILG